MCVYVCARACVRACVGVGRGFIFFPSSPLLLLHQAHAHGTGENIMGQMEWYTQHCQLNVHSMIEIPR